MGKDENIGEVRYGIIDRGIFGLRFIVGLVTGVQYTKNDPIYKIEFEDNSYWTDKIADSEVKLIELMAIPTIEFISERHNIKVKFPEENLDSTE